MTQKAPLIELSAYAQYPAGYDADFVVFHQNNPWVYQWLVGKAREMKASGCWFDVGVRGLIEILRYSPEFLEHLKTDPAFRFGLNNDFSTPYSRLILANELDLQTFIRVRRTEEEIALGDPTQTALEFD